MLSEGTTAPSFRLAAVEGTTSRTVRVPDGERATLLAFSPQESLDPGAAAELAFLDLSPGLSAVVVSDGSCATYRRIAEMHDQPWLVPVLSDVDRHLAEAYDLRYRRLGAESAGYLLGDDGTVRRVWRPADRLEPVLRHAHRNYSTTDTTVQP